MIKAGYTTLISVGILAAVQAGCHEFAVDCREAYGAAPVEGQWAIVGEGRRSNCDDRNFNGAFDFSTPEPLSVDQFAEDETGTSRLRLGSDPDPGIGSSFDLDGFVNGICVTFSAYERSDDTLVNNLEFEFHGTYAANRIDGDFTGIGPANCDMDGTFQVTIF